MSCKRISSKARREQDYYLNIDNGTATEEERLAFVRYDSHGGDIEISNPVFVAKSHYGMYINILKEWRYHEGWSGGVELVTCSNIRMLIEAFGREQVDEWIRAKEFLESNGVSANFWST